MSASNPAVFGIPVSGDARSLRRKVAETRAHAASGGLVRGERPMKLWVMAGLISIAAAPAAFATEDTNAAAVSQRHVGAQTGVDPAMSTGARPQKDTVEVAP